jgi:hypothetical protein
VRSIIDGISGLYKQGIEIVPPKDVERMFRNQNAKLNPRDRVKFEGNDGGD